MNDATKPAETPKSKWKSWAIATAIGVIGVIAVKVMTGQWSANYGSPVSKAATSHAIASTDQLVDAIATVRPDMQDVDTATASQGAVLLAVWGGSKMRWAEINALPTAKYGMVMKDSESEVGKKICLAGDVVEISRAKELGPSVYDGAMISESAHLFRILAVRSTGQILAGHHARFCGVVTGQVHYPNSIGGIAHAVQLV